MPDTTTDLNDAADLSTPQYVDVPDAKQWHGRRLALDLKDHAHPAERFLARRAKAGVDERYWRPSGTVDQGPTPTCVAFSTRVLFGAGPVRNVKNLPDPHEWYRACLEVDEWPGNDPRFGTSIRASMKVGQARGWIGEYAWTESFETMSRWVLERGPCLVGSVWPDSMGDPDRAGWLHLDRESTFAGMHADGHAWCVIGYSRKLKAPDGTKGAFIMQQTWGQWGLTKYGCSGIARVSNLDMDSLLRAAGECCMPVEILQGKGAQS